MARTLKKNILIVTFPFPPLQGSSGVLRILSFAKRLRDAGWKIRVITVPGFAYARTEEANLKSIPHGIRVIRAFALHNSKHLSFRGKYIRSLSIPDNWWTWIPSAFLVTAIQILLQRPSVLLTTYPIPSSLVVCWLVKRIFKLPLVVDFRDPMLQDDYPRTRSLRRAFTFIETRTIRHADLIVVTTPGSRKHFLDRYGSAISEKLVLIENGVDVSVFQRAQLSLPKRRPGTVNRRVLLHSGLVYPIERDPSSLFAAIARALQQNLISEPTFELRLRGSGHEHHLSELAQSFGIGHLVSLLPSIPYEEAAKEILSVDGLLVLQAGDCNSQIPAKVYEYLYTRKPILALADPGGDTGSLLLSEGVIDVAGLENHANVYSAFCNYLTNRLGTGDDSRQTKLTDSFSYSRDEKAKALESAILKLIS